MARTKTLSSDFYHSSSIFSQEIENIFKNEWLWVARSGDLSQAGSYITTDIIGYPIIILRDQSFNLKAFHNVCRHRAAKVLSAKSGACKHMICPYHGWKYDLNGKLMDAPKFFAHDDFNQEKHSLFDISIEERFGLIFINLNTNSQDLCHWLGGFDAVISQYFQSNLVHHSELRFDVHANWKTYVDNYQEGYHIPIVHPQLNRDVVWQEYALENKDEYSIHSVPERRGSNQPGSFGWHFPNFIFNIYGRGIVFQRIEPLKPKWCRVVYNPFRPSDVSENDFENKEGKYQLEVSLEDQKLVPEIQQNLQTGIYNEGPLSKKYETGVSFFHGLYLKKLNLEKTK